MPYGILAADQITSSVTGVSLGAGNATRFKNRIINGDMRIDQRNAGASVTPTGAQYLIDRWQINTGTASKISFQQNAGSVTPPVGFTNYLGCTSTSAYTPASGDYFQLRQVIEGLNIADLGWGTANAKTVTLSFWIRSSLTGQFGGAIRNNPNFTYCYPFSFTIPTANTWTQISITIVGPNASQGTWNTNNTAGLEVVFDLGSGSTYLGTAGAWASGVYAGATGDTKLVSTNAATFYITGVQLEVGSIATGFEYVDYGTQLQMCMRYYQALQQFYGLKTGSGYTRINIGLPAVMRTAPAVAFNDFVGNVSKISVYASNDARTDNISPIACSGAAISMFQLLPNNTDSAPGYVFSASMSAEL